MHALLPGDPRRPHVHGAAVVGSYDHLLPVAMRFLEEGLQAGDLTVLCCPPETEDHLRRHLGGAIAAVGSEPRVCMYGGVRAPDALVVTRALLDQAAATGSGRLRILGEVQFGGTPAEWREGERYESAANAVLATAPLTALCVYNEAVLPAPVVATASATHPLLVSDGAAVRSERFQPPADYLRHLPSPRGSVEDLAPPFAIDDAPSLVELRHWLAVAIDAHVTDPDLAQDLHLAASEVASNAFRHGRRPVSARMWVDGRQLVCAITDSGTGFDDPTAGFVPAHGLDLGRGGMGLWLARKLWDQVDLLAGPEGLTVRLSTALG